MSIKESLQFLAMFIPTFLLLGFAVIALTFSPDGTGIFGSLLELSPEIQRHLFMVAEESGAGPY